MSASTKNHAVVLHDEGIACFQSGQPEQGIAHVQASCDLEPGNAAWLNDLGNMLFALQRYEPAACRYEQALAILPDDANVWNNLGSARIQLGQRDAAIAAFERAIDIDPDFAPALTLLGSIYESSGDVRLGAAYQSRAYVLPPYEGKSKQMLGICFYFLGRLQEAAEVYRIWLEEEPGHPIALHMYAACSQSGVPGRAADPYVETYFDKMADSFDARLVNDLDYDGPRLVADGMASVAAPARQFDVLDLGCGTGLCGVVMAPYARRLVGVDLSAGMLEKAAARGPYDTLTKREITSYLDASAPETFDVVVAADSLIYFGGLEAVLGGVARVLRPGGHVVLTVEVIPDAAPDAASELHPSGRYRHAAHYVAAALGQAGMEPALVRSAKIRDELGVAVMGILVVARRRGQ